MKKKEIKKLTKKQMIENLNKLKKDLFNFRFQKVNGQIKSPSKITETKRNIASSYQKWGEDNSIEFIKEIHGTTSNYWLNALLAENIKERDDILEITNKNGVMTRPAWKPMHQLKINQKFETFVPLVNTEWLFERIICMPSSFSKDLDLS